MRTDLYTKTVLTIIAICLAVIAIQQIGLVPKAYADTPSRNWNGVNYGLVPLNEDGTIDVNIKSVSEPVEVNLQEIGGYWVRGGSAVVKVKVVD